ncbi:MAG: hypothetical protein KDK97_15350 [Verrucomicrobiales bacterium]|nr:hypothetical protein [Verrucomicrobiales bacterium]
MKRSTAILAIAASLIFPNLTTTANAQSLALINRITEITPSQGMAGQTITVKITRPELQLPSGLKELQAKLRKDIVLRFPGRVGSQTTRILFTGAQAGQFVDGENVVRVNDDTFTVRVPSSARSGPMQLRMGLGTSTSTVRFTLTTVGYSIENQSQYNIVSIKMDGVERLTPGQVVAAVPATSPNINILDVGATAGNHNLQITIGIDASRPVMVVFLPTMAAQRFLSPSQGFANPIGILPMRAGDYLVSSPNTVSAVGTSRTVSWQALEVQANGNLVVHGFDFTFNRTTGVTSFVHWIGDRPNVAGRGTVLEPSLAQWGVNAAQRTLTLRSSTGSVYTNFNVTFPNASGVAADGLTYTMQ